jgi:hypothetical protein
LYVPFTYIGGGVNGTLQKIDGYYYLPKWINPPQQIAIAREKEWKEGDLLQFSFPKSGTHFLLLTTLLIGYKGDLPPKTDIHSLSYSLEFAPATGGRSLDDTPDVFPTNPRVLVSHMPRNHVKYSDTARFLYVIRDPVATLASLRRMEYLLFGPILNQSLEEFIRFNLHGRE